MAEKKLPKVRELDTQSPKAGGKALFTMSIKQQERRHRCFCGVVGCVKHPPKKAGGKGIRKNSIVQLNQSASDESRAKLKLYGDPKLVLQYRLNIERIVEMTYAPAWQRLTSTEKIAKIQDLQRMLQKYEGLEQSFRGKELVGRAKQKIGQWKNG